MSFQTTLIITDELEVKLGCFNPLMQLTYDLHFRGDRDLTGRRLRQNSTSRPLSAINDLFDSRDFLFKENQDDVR